MKSSHPDGVVYIDTKNLDGETNLKEKIVPKELQSLSIELEIPQLQGKVDCDLPNENLDKWDGNVSTNYSDKKFNCNMKNMLLWGCYIRNIDHCYGIVVYTGNETKIMQNSKKPPTKVSNVMKLMNIMLYSMFGF